MGGHNRQGKFAGDAGFILMGMLSNSDTYHCICVSGGTAMLSRRGTSVIFAQSAVIGILSLPDLKDRYSGHALFPVYPFISPAALVDRIDNPSSRDHRPPAYELLKVRRCGQNVPSGTERENCVRLREKFHRMGRPFINGTRLGT